ncbi:autotransporter outer membrane beta-barrel domain-containing protein [Phascolarctobacterium succinatutens]|uniref:autotransporter outer membrane beta-barrel domain-containing protein n=1 Tax=Phascolarctobacterium succinatutens TaxID=626940 RepID=UPI0026F32521|nr:autotransporter outer membrane beta-barrel domain-containing protein [Phascolarctobacterium succinatutens]
MKSNKALARKILCALLAAGVVGVSGSALAADTYGINAGVEDNINANLTYTDGKIDGFDYGLNAQGDYKQSKESKISLTTDSVNITANKVGIQGQKWAVLTIGASNTNDVNIIGKTNGIVLKTGSSAELTGNKVKIANESKSLLINIDNSYSNVNRPAQLIVKGKQIELKSSGKVIEANSNYKKAESLPKASVNLGDESTELLEMTGTDGIHAKKNSEIIGNAKDISLVVNSNAKTYGMQATGEEAQVQLTAKDNLLIDIGGSGAIAVYSSAASAKVNLAGNDVKIQAQGTDAPVYGVFSETGSNVSIAGNTVEISTVGGKNGLNGKIGSSAIYADKSNIIVDANKIVVNTDKAKENAYAVYGNCGSHITLGKDANSEVQISSNSEGNAMGVVVATASTSATTAAASQVTVQGAKINVAAEGGQKARGLYAQDKNEIIVGNAGSDIHISAKGEDAAGIIAIEHGSVALNGQNAVIDADGSKYSTGIHVQNNDMTDETNRATVNVNTENTTINAVTALSAMSHSVLNVNSNLVTNGKNAILTRGNSDVNINTDGQHTTQLNGDIVFNYDGDSSGTGIDSNVNVNLNGEGSSWTGNTKAEWNSASGKPDEAKLAVSHMNLNVANGAQWNPTTIKSQNNITNGVENIAINNLALNNGIINLDSSNLAGDDAVNIENLTGTGGTINTDNVDNKLSIENKAADTSLTVNGTKEVTDAIASGEANLQKLADVVKSNDKSAADSVTSDANDIIGGYSAKVLDGKVVVDSIKTVENATNRAISDIMNISLMTWRQENNDMNKRLGELRDSKGEHGAWARMARGESKYGSHGVKNQYNYYQVGYDEKLSTNPNWTVGVALTRTEGNSTFAAGSGENKHTGLAIYGSYLSDSGSFVDLIAKYARLDNEFKTVGAGVGDADYKENAYSLSAEYGKRFTGDNGFWIEPQVELTYGTVGSVDYLTNKGYSVHKDSTDSLVGRLGFALGKNIKQGNVYVRASYLYDFDGESTVTMSGAGTASFKQDLGGGWWEVGVGTNLNLSDATHLYFDVEKTFGGNVATPWQWNAGVRCSF